MKTFSINILYSNDSYVVTATDHRAAARSIKPQPGTQLVVATVQTTIRYHVDKLGRLVEQSRYSAERNITP